MGTNFYFHTKNKELLKIYAPYSYELTDTPEFAYTIHVAKTSMGWLPLFQAHREGINSVKEYKELYDSGEVQIYDEYGTKYNWEEFDERVLQFNGGRLGAKEPEYIGHDLDDKYCPEYIPISHLPGSKQSYNCRFPHTATTLSKDDEGYEFEEIDFS